MSIQSASLEDEVNTIQNQLSWLTKVISDLSNEDLELERRTPSLGQHIYTHENELMSLTSEKDKEINELTKEDGRLSSLFTEKEPSRDVGPNFRFRSHNGRSIRLMDKHVSVSAYNTGVNEDFPSESLTSTEDVNVFASLQKDLLQLQELNTQLDIRRLRRGKVSTSGSELLHGKHMNESGIFFDNIHESVQTELSKISESTLYSTIHPDHPLNCEKSGLSKLPRHESAPGSVKVVCRVQPRNSNSTNKATQSIQQMNIIQTEVGNFILGSVGSYLNQNMTKSEEILYVSEHPEILDDLPSVSDLLAKNYIDVISSNELALYDKTRRAWRSFAFDKVIAEEVNLDSVFREFSAFSDIVTQGESACMLAYGTSESGKLFTMHGTVSNPGIIPRMVTDIFKKLFLHQSRLSHQYNISLPFDIDSNGMCLLPGAIMVSVMSVINEEVHDLLFSNDSISDPPLVQGSYSVYYDSAGSNRLQKEKKPARTVRSPPLPLRGSGSTTEVVGLRRIVCRNVDACIATIGIAMRHVDVSARSHLVVRLDTIPPSVLPVETVDNTISDPRRNSMLKPDANIQSNQTATGKINMKASKSTVSKQDAATLVTTSRVSIASRETRLQAFEQFLLSCESHSSRTGSLFLLALAGSERLKSSVIAGSHMRELRYAHLGLSALGSALEAVNKNQHANCRDSILTLLLKGVLNSQSHLGLLLCIEAESAATEDTLSTLKFGTRAYRKPIASAQQVLHARTGVELVRGLHTELQRAASALRTVISEKLAILRSVEGIAEGTEFKWSQDDTTTKELRAAQKKVEMLQNYVKHLISSGVLAISSSPRRSGGTREKTQEMLVGVAGENGEDAEDSYFHQFPPLEGQFRKGYDEVMQGEEGYISPSGVSGISSSSSIPLQVQCSSSLSTEARTPSKGHKRLDGFSSHEESGNILESQKHRYFTSEVAKLKSPLPNGYSDQISPPPHHASSLLAQSRKSLRGVEIQGNVGYTSTNSSSSHLPGLKGSGLLQTVSLSSPPRALRTSHSPHSRQLSAVSSLADGDMRSHQSGETSKTDTQNLSFLPLQTHLPSRVLTATEYPLYSDQFFPHSSSGSAIALKLDTNALDVSCSLGSPQRNRPLSPSKHGLGVPYSASLTPERLRTILSGSSSQMHNQISSSDSVYCGPSAEKDIGGGQTGTKVQVFGPTGIRGPVYSSKVGLMSANAHHRSSLQSANHLKPSFSDEREDEMELPSAGSALILPSNASSRGNKGALTTSGSFHEGIGGRILDRGFVITQNPPHSVKPHSGLKEYRASSRPQGQMKVSIPATTTGNRPHHPTVGLSNGKAARPVSEQLQRQRERRMWHERAMKEGRLRNVGGGLPSSVSTNAKRNENSQITALGRVDLSDTLIGQVSGKGLAPDLKMHLDTYHAADDNSADGGDSFNFPEHEHSTADSKEESTDDSDDPTEGGKYLVGIINSTKYPAEGSTENEEVEGEGEEPAAAVTPTARPVLSYRSSSPNRDMKALAMYRSSQLSSTPRGLSQKSPRKSPSKQVGESNKSPVNKKPTLSLEESREGPLTPNSRIYMFSTDDLSFPANSTLSLPPVPYNTMEIEPNLNIEGNENVEVNTCSASALPLPQQNVELMPNANIYMDLDYPTSPSLDFSATNESLPLDVDLSITADIDQYMDMMANGIDMDKCDEYPIVSDPDHPTNSSASTATHSIPSATTNSASCILTSSKPSSVGSRAKYRHSISTFPSQGAAKSHSSGPYRNSLSTMPRSSIPDRVSSSTRPVEVSSKNRVQEPLGRPRAPDLTSDQLKQLTSRSTSGNSKSDLSFKSGRRSLGRKIGELRHENSSQLNGEVQITSPSTTQQQIPSPLNRTGGGEREESVDHVDGKGLELQDSEKVKQVVGVTVDAGVFLPNQSFNNPSDHLTDSVVSMTPHHQQSSMEISDADVSMLLTSVPSQNRAPQYFPSSDSFNQAGRRLINSPRSIPPAVTPEAMKKLSGRRSSFDMNHKSNLNFYNTSYPGSGPAPGPIRGPHARSPRKSIPSDINSADVLDCAVKATPKNRRSSVKNTVEDEKFTFSTPTQLSRVSNGSDVFNFEAADYSGGKASRSVGPNEMKEFIDGETESPLTMKSESSLTPFDSINQLSSEPENPEGVASLAPAVDIIEVEKPAESIIVVASEAAPSGEGASILNPSDLSQTKPLINSLAALSNFTLNLDSDSDKDSSRTSSDYEDDEVGSKLSSLQSRGDAVIVSSSRDDLSGEISAVDSSCRSPSVVIKPDISIPLSSRSGGNESVVSNFEQNSGCRVGPEESPTSLPSSQVLFDLGSGAAAMATTVLPTESKPVSTEKVLKSRQPLSPPPQQIPASLLTVPISPFSPASPAERIPTKLPRSSLALEVLPNDVSCDSHVPAHVHIHSIPQPLAVEGNKVVALGEQASDADSVRDGVGVSRDAPADDPPTLSDSNVSDPTLDSATVVASLAIPTHSFNNPSFYQPAYNHTSGNPSKSSANLNNLFSMSEMGEDDDNVFSDGDIDGLLD